MPVYVCLQSTFPAIVYIYLDTLVPLPSTCISLPLSPCRDSEEILGAVKKLQEFQVPQFMLEKMKTFMRSVQGVWWWCMCVCVCVRVCVCACVRVCVSQSCIPSSAYLNEMCY